MRVALVVAVKQCAVQKGDQYKETPGRGCAWYAEHRKRSVTIRKNDTSGPTVERARFSSTVPPLSQWPISSVCLGYSF